MDRKRGKRSSHTDNEENKKIVSAPSETRKKARVGSASTVAKKAEEESPLDLSQYGVPEHVGKAIIHQILSHPDVKKLFLAQNEGAHAHNVSKNQSQEPGSNDSQSMSSAGSVVSESDEDEDDYDPEEDEDDEDEGEDEEAEDENITGRETNSAILHPSPDTSSIKNNQIKDKGFANSEAAPQEFLPPLGESERSTTTHAKMVEGLVNEAFPIGSIYDDLGMASVAKVLQLGEIPNSEAHPLHNLSGAQPGTVAKRTRSHVNRQHLTLDDLDLLKYEDPLVDCPGDIELRKFLHQLQKSNNLQSDTEGSEQDDDADYDHLADESRDSDANEDFDGKVDEDEIAALDLNAAKQKLPKRNRNAVKKEADLKPSQHRNSQFDYIRRFAISSKQSSATDPDLKGVLLRQYHQLLVQCHVAMSSHAVFTKSMDASKKMLEQLLEKESRHHDLRDGQASIPRSIVTKTKDILELPFPNLDPAAPLASQHRSDLIPKDSVQSQLLASFDPYFDCNLRIKNMHDWPKPGRMLWSPVEDRLMVLGLLCAAPDVEYLGDACGLVNSRVLPTFTDRQIKLRHNNLGKGGLTKRNPKKQANIIAAIKEASINGNLLEFAEKYLQPTHQIFPYKDLPGPAQSLMESKNVNLRHENQICLDKLPLHNSVGQREMYALTHPSTHSSTAQILPSHYQVLNQCTGPGALSGQMPSNTPGCASAPELAVLTLAANRMLPERGMANVGSEHTRPGRQPVHINEDSMFINNVIFPSMVAASKHAAQALPNASKSFSISEDPLQSTSGTIKFTKEEDRIILQSVKSCGTTWGDAAVEHAMIRLGHRPRGEIHRRIAELKSIAISRKKSATR